MKVRRHLVILGMVLLALGAFAPPGQSQTTDWVFSANYTANSDFFSCSNVPFTVPLAGGSTSFACDIATVSVTVNIAGLTFSVSGFGNVSFDGISCSGTGGGGSSITVTGTGFFTVGTISGDGVCTSEFGDFPFTVSGTYDASGGSAGALSVR